MYIIELRKKKKEKKKENEKEKRNQLILCVTIKLQNPRNINDTNPTFGCILYNLV